MTVVSVGGVSVKTGGIGPIAVGGVPVPAAAPIVSGSTLASLPGTLDSYDASTPAMCLDLSGNAIGQWAGAQIGSVRNGGSLTDALVYAGTGDIPVTYQAGRGRVGGPFGGIGLYGSGGSWPFTRRPLMHQEAGLKRAGTVALPASQDWAMAIAWCRPNLKQQASAGVRPQTDLCPLITLGSTPILWLDSVYRSTVGGADTGGLFCLGTKAVSTIAPRHAGIALLVNKAGVGVSVYLDTSGTPAATGIACPAALATAASLYLMFDPANQYFGGSQCWFHEFWRGGSMTTANIQAALTNLGRYSPGVRKGAIANWNTQSEGNYAFGDGGMDPLCTGIQYYSGLVSFDTNVNTDATAAGQGISNYAATGGGANTCCLIDPQDGSDPSTWSAGTVLTRMQAEFQAELPVHQADYGPILTLWGETDSAADGHYTFTSLAAYTASLTKHVAQWTRWNALTRAIFGKSAAASPIMATDVMGTGNAVAAGRQMVSTAYRQLPAAQNFNIVSRNGMDESSRGGTGINDGSSVHQTAADSITWFKRMVGGAARALAACGYTAPGVTLPAAGMAGGPPTSGPAFTAAWFCTDGTFATTTSTPTRWVRATVTHDTGTDISLNSVAQGGAGLTLRDGWQDAYARGNIILATAAARLDATHVGVTYASAPASAASACRLMYCEAMLPIAGDTGRVGTGNGIYDNSHTVTPPAGYDIGADLGSGYRVPHMVAMTTLGGVQFS